MHSFFWINIQPRPQRSKITSPPHHTLPTTSSPKIKDYSSPRSSAVLPRRGCRREQILDLIDSRHRRWFVPSRGWGDGRRATVRGIVEVSERRNGLTHSHYHDFSWRGFLYSTSYSTSDRDYFHICRGVTDGTGLDYSLQLSDWAPGHFTTHLPTHLPTPTLVNLPYLHHPLTIPVRTRGGHHIGVSVRDDASIGAQPQLGRPSSIEGKSGGGRPLVACDLMISQISLI